MLPEVSNELGTGPGPARRVRGPDYRDRSLLAGRPRTRLWSGLTVSMLAHVVMFGGALAYAHWTPPRVVPDKPIVAKLVRLGKPRDEKLLPRLPAAPPPPPPQETAVPVPAPPPTTPPPDVQPAKTIDVPVTPTPAQAAADRQKKLADAFSKLGPAPTGPVGKKPEELPGREDGDARGSAEEAAEGDRYLALVDQALRDNYVLPTTISQKERIALVCVIWLDIAKDGKIREFRILEPSSNGHFDRAIEAGVQRTKLPPPPPAFFAAYPDGLPVRFKP